MISIRCCLLLMTAVVTVMSRTLTSAAVHSPGGLRAKLPYAVEQCFAYDATRASRDASVRVDAYYRITSASAPDSPHVTVSVRGPGMIKIFDQALKSSDDESTFAFHAMMSGTHRVCFVNLKQDFVWLELEMIGQNEKKRNPLTTSFAEVHDIPEPKSNYNSLVERIQNGVALVMAEADLLKERNHAFDRTVASTYGRVVAFSVLSCVVVCFSIAWQVVAFRRLFHAKKLV